MSQETGLQNYRYFDEHDDIRAIMEENLAGERLSLSSLDRIKVPSGGATSWEINTINGTESVQAVTGIIVHEQKARTYWEKSIEEAGGDVPPDCYSEDLRNGHGQPGGECDACPFSQFGPDNERPECREGRTLFLLSADATLPVAVNIPPSSLRRYIEYKVRLSKAGVPLTGIETSLSLEKDKSRKGITFARIVFRAGARASKEQKVLLKEQGDSVKALLAAVPGHEALPPAPDSDESALAKALESDTGI